MIIDKVEEIRTALVQIKDAQAATMFVVTEIKGDNKLQSQVLSFHIGQLKEFKVDVLKLIEKRETDVDTRHKALEERIEKLEKWQIRIIGIASVISGMFALFFSDIKDAIFGSK